MNTLGQIAKSLSLSPNTLYVYKDRHKEDFPAPALVIGAGYKGGSMNLYDVDEVEAWLIARRLESDRKKEA